VLRIYYRQMQTEIQSVYSYKHSRIREKHVGG